MTAKQYYKSRLIPLPRPLSMWTLSRTTTLTYTVLGSRCAFPFSSRGVLSKTTSALGASVSAERAGNWAKFANFQHSRKKWPVRRGLQTNKLVVRFETCPNRLKTFIYARWLNTTDITSLMVVCIRKNWFGNQTELFDRLGTQDPFCGKLLQLNVYIIYYVLRARRDGHNFLTRVQIKFPTGAHW